MNSLRLDYLYRMIAAAVVILPMTAHAACKHSESGLWNYGGEIGLTHKVRMSLVFDGDGIRGLYFYATQLHDIRLTGRITDGTTIVLDESDALGKVVARFDGGFVEHDPRGKFGNSKLKCETIVGTWHRLDSAKKLPVYLSLDNISGGSLANRYGGKDDGLIHRGALRFQNAIKGGDRAMVASLIVYPIDVELSGRKKRLRGPRDLLASYDTIFSAKYRAAIANAIPWNMFVRDQGVMLGNGEVWFDADGKITALNNQ